MIFADNVDSRHVQAASIRARPEIARILFKDSHLFVVEEERPGHYLAKLYGLGSDHSKKIRQYTLGSSWLCDCDGEEVIVRTGADDGVILYRLDTKSETPICDIPSATAICVSGTEPNHFLVACGNQHGDVRVTKCRIAGDAVESEEVLSCRPHEAAITSLAFIEDHSVLSGGNDRKIVRLDLRPEHASDPAVSEFRLHLQCAGMNVTGMKSPAQKNLLMAIGASSS